MLTIMFVVKLSRHMRLQIYCILYLIFVEFLGHKFGTMIHLLYFKHVFRFRSLSFYIVVYIDITDGDCGYSIVLEWISLC